MVAGENLELNHGQFNSQVKPLGDPIHSDRPQLLEVQQRPHLAKAYRLLISPAAMAL